jgi:shikimate dehydrogenase
MSVAEQMLMIDGHTKLIAHIGYPTQSFKAPLIYNPYFASIGLNACVVPMGVRTEDYATSLRAIFRFSNVHGALITMPHKVTTLDFLDEASPTVRIAGACNAILLRADGTLYGDMFDGEGFVRGALRKGCMIAGSSALVVGSGGVGCAIAASLAAAGAGRISLFDINVAAMTGLADRLRQHYPAVDVMTGSNDPGGHDVVVNATPMGMKSNDPMPMDVTRIAPSSFVGEVVMKQERTAFLAAAEARGCRTQVGLDMLYEQIPAYLEFFGFPTTTAERLRVLSHVPEAMRASVAHADTFPRAANQG